MSEMYKVERHRHRYMEIESIASLDESEMIFIVIELP